MSKLEVRYQNTHNVSIAQIVLFQICFRYTQRKKKGEEEKKRKLDVVDMQQLTDIKTDLCCYQRIEYACPRAQ